MNVGSELNNTVNKTHIGFNDFIYSGLDKISLRTVRSEERRLYSQGKFQWKQIVEALRDETKNGRCEGA